MVDSLRNESCGCCAKSQNLDQLIGFAGSASLRLAMIKREKQDVFGLISLLVALGLFGPSVSATATWYAATGSGASDANPGTAQQPVRNVAKTVSLAKPGDTVVFRDCRFFACQVGVSATSAHYLTIKNCEMAYPGAYGVHLNGSGQQDADLDELAVGVNAHTVREEDLMDGLAVFARYGLEGRMPLFHVSLGSTAGLPGVPRRGGGASNPTQRKKLRGLLV
jgi:hypothetical protein